MTSEYGEGMDGVKRTVEFENDLVSVVRYRFEPHAKVPIHHAPNLVAVWLTDVQLRLSFLDGTA